MTTSIGRESCRGEIKPWVGNRSHCLTSQRNRSTVEVPGRYPLSVPRVSFVRRGGQIPRWWEINASEVEAKADELGVEVSALLCSGCERRRQRLITEGSWPG